MLSTRKLIISASGGKSTDTACCTPSVKLVADSKFTIEPSKTLQHVYKILQGCFTGDCSGKRAMFEH